MSQIYHYYYYYFNVYLFLRERAQVEEGQRERETEDPNELHADSREPDVGLELTNHEIMTWTKVRHLTNWATQVPLGITFDTPPQNLTIAVDQKPYW